MFNLCGPPFISCFLFHVTIFTAFNGFIEILYVVFYISISIFPPFNMNLLIITRYFRCNFDHKNMDWWIMVFNITFNNISVISWRLVLLMEETGGTGENHRPVASHWQTSPHNFLSSTPRLSGVRILNEFSIA